MSRPPATPAQRRRDAAFGRRLARARAKKYPTQRELADAIGVAPSTIFRIEQGRVSCSESVLALLCTALGCSPATLTGKK